jgi:thymidylate kinase
MPDPILIGIAGVKGAGKDTTADFIEEFAANSLPALSVRRRGFGDKVKWAFARQFFPEISIEDAIAWCNKYKNSSNGIVVPKYVVSEKGIEFDRVFVPFRDALAQFATEGARDIYGLDHWVNQLLPEGHDRYWNGSVIWHEEFSEQWIVERNERVIFIPPDICVITDLRFENELRRIHSLKGVCCKIHRKDAEDAVIEEARQAGREVHRSELGMPDEMFDIVIDNSDNDMKKAKQRTFEQIARLVDDR